MLTEAEIKKLSGLSAAEVQSRQKTAGFNELPSSRCRSIFAIIFDVWREPMFLLLVACGTVYLLLGDINEALMLLGFVFVIMGITVYQENKTEHALEALRDLSSPRALVIRDGEQLRIAGREVVTGDVIILREGDRVPADGEVLWGLNLSIDESLLTGESVPVQKLTELDKVFSGTLVVGGQGIARVAAIGLGTEMGKIGKALQTIKEERTHLQNETGRLVKYFSLIGVFLCLLVIAAYGFTRQNWLEGFLAGLTLAMAILPEEFPVVLTIFLALGAWRISKKQVLARRINAVETLGSAAVICSDKTGTITQNKMSIAQLFCAGHVLNDIGDQAPLPEEFHELVEYGILASKRDPFDPMEKALIRLGDEKLRNTEHVHNSWELAREYPLSRELMALSHVWRSPDRANFVVAAKGAPEAIADLCHLSAGEQEKMQQQVAKMADNGLRVLGIARASFTSQNLPGEQHDFGFQLIGLIGLADPVRATVPAAIKECYAAGIRVIMITGDYPGTARNIARQIGLKEADNFLTGPEIDRLTEEELAKRVREINVFCRVVPEQKLRIVIALKNNGAVVAMTGDGVNDAPALKAANIGIAMGERGTDVAREAADLVLLNDDFSSIVGAVRSGRRIFDNLKKAMAYILAVHVPIAGLSLIPVLLGWPLVLFPVHVVFLELIIDPACSVVFETEAPEAKIMDRPPRNAREPLFGRRVLIISLLQGAVVLLTTMLVYFFALRLGLAGNEARALTFSALIFANLALILTNRSWSSSSLKMLAEPNAAFWLVAAAALIFLGLGLYNPFFRNIFSLEILHWQDLSLAAGAGLLTILPFELIKLISNREKLDLLEEITPAG